jgi:TonB family protein
MTRTRIITPAVGIFCLLLLLASAVYAATTKAPELKNRQEIDRLIMGSNAGVLIRSGVSAKAELLIDVDEKGRVVGRQLVQPSGITIIDGVLLDVARRMVFTPATVEGTPVPAAAKVPFVFGD